MKTILLLGGYGFLGTNVMKYVDTHLADQYRFIVFDKMDHHMGGVTFTNIVKTYAGDFSDSMLLKRIFRENQIDIIIHSLSTTVPIESANARYDVHVNAIAPGVVADVISDIDKYDDLYLKGAVGKRYILPEEIAEIATYLMSDASKCVSGEIIPCNQSNHLK